MTTSWGVTGGSRRDWWAQPDGDAGAGGATLPPGSPAGSATGSTAGLAGVSAVRAIPTAALYDQESGDPDPIGIDDVQQRSFGDCYLMAPLAALASTPAGRDVIRNAITENKNAAGKTVSYTVSLHEPRSHLWGLGATTYESVRITVDATFVAGQAEPRADGVVQEVWPLVIEKAYASLLGGYGRLADGGDPARALEALTGQPVRTYALNEPPSWSSWFVGYSPRQLQSDLAARRFVLLGTQNPLPDAGSADTSGPYALHPDHVYVVTGTLTIEGRLYVQLRNPWNYDQPDPVPFDELRRWFRDGFVGSARP